MGTRSLPVSELPTAMRGVVDDVEASGEPVLIAGPDGPQAVVLRYRDYESLLARAEDGHPRIEHRPDISGGEPIIRGTRITVRHIVERTQGGQSPDEIVVALPHLSLAQVFDALSYYFDHREEVDKLLATSTPEAVLERNRLRTEQLGDGIEVVLTRST